MADKKITALTDLAASGKDSAIDLLHIIDYSASPVNKKISVANLFSNVNTDTHIYGASKTFEIGYGNATNAALTVSTAATDTADATVTINDDGNQYTNFTVKSLNSDSILTVDAGLDNITINGDSHADVDFTVNGDTTTLIYADGGEDAVAIGTGTVDTAYTLTVAATGTNGIKSAGSIDVTGNITASADATVGVVGAGNLFLPSVESITANTGTANHCTVGVTTSIVTVTGGCSGALPNGTAVGQLKIISCIANSGADNYVNTPTTGNGFASFTMNAVGDAMMLQWQTAGWTVLSFGSCTIA